jgi:dimethylargininase
MLVALTREVSPAIDRCELTHLPRTTIDVDLARRQHRQYEECLAGLGCAVRRLPAAPELPDAVFVEDTCLVLDELAVITRPGAASRRFEMPAVAEAVRAYRPLRFIRPPGTLDGGDVLRLGRRLFAGLSSRTNEAGIDQLRAHLAPHGYTVEAVSFTGCLHLKTAATVVGGNSVLVNRSWVDPSIFGRVTAIDIDPAEPFGANALLVGETVVYHAAFPGTQKRLEEHGLTVVAIEVSELAKAEGGVTCCSLIIVVEQGMEQVQ